MKDKIERIFEDWNREDTFSGVFSVSDEKGILFERACGFRNFQERLPNEPSTAFGIASGTKLMTGIAVCRLIDEGKLSLEDKIWDILPYDLGCIDKNVTLYHLLTHTSGVGDYIDEESLDIFEEMADLYHQYPVYLWHNLSYYLQMFINLKQKFKPGERFGYSNTGYVLLGLAVESVSKVKYQQYINEAIIKPLGMKHTGFYAMDRLPVNTAYGYIYDKKAKEWYSNIFSMPVIGGSDGGLFTCAGDLDRLWHSLFDGKILSADRMKAFLYPYVKQKEDGSIYYGLGIYQYCRNNRKVYFAVGADAGVSFFTAFFPDLRIAASALGNTERGTRSLLNQLFEEFN